MFYNFMLSNLNLKPVVRFALCSLRVVNRSKVIIQRILNESEVKDRLPQMLDCASVFFHRHLRTMSIHADEGKWRNQAFEENGSARALLLTSTQ